MMQIERAPAAAQGEKNGHDQLARLVVLQRANGSFELNDKLAQLVGVSLSELHAKLRRICSGEAKQQQMWATALALAAEADEATAWTCASRCSARRVLGRSCAVWGRSEQSASTRLDSSWNARLQSHAFHT